MADIQRIERNVRKMADQGAPEVDIDGYLASEGLTPEQFRNRNMATVQPAPPALPDVGFWDSFADDMTLGSGDEIRGGLSAVAKSGGQLFRGEPVTFGQNFETARSGHEDALNQWRKENPGKNIAGMGLSIAAGGAPIGNAIARAPGFFRKAGRVAGIGGGLGTVSGFMGTDGGVPERLAGAATGGVFGTGASLALGGGGLILTKVFGPPIQAMLERLGKGPKRAAARKVLQALERDEIDPNRAMAKLKMLGPEAVIADVSEGTRSLARGVATVPGPTKGAAQRLLERRHGQQGARVTAATNRGLGTTGNYYGAADELIEARKLAASPLYKRAYEAHPVVWNERLSGLMGRKRMQKAFKKAQDIADTSGAAAPNTNKMDLQSWDLVKQGLDDQIETYRDKVTGVLRLDNEGRAILSLKNDLVSALDDATGGPNGVYAAARRAFSGPSDSLDAMARGRGFMKGDEELTAKMIERMTPAEREFYREGAAREIRRMIETRPDGADVSKILWGTPDKRKKLEALFPNKRSFREFEKTMLGESRMARTRNEVTQGSRTAVVEAEQSDAGIDPGILTDIVQNSRGGLFNLIANGVRGGVEYARRPPPQLRKEIGGLLFDPDQAAQQRILNELLGQPTVRREIGENVRGGLLGASVFGTANRE